MTTGNVLNNMPADLPPGTTWEDMLQQGYQGADPTGGTGYRQMTPEEGARRLNEMQAKAMQGGTIYTSDGTMRGARANDADLEYVTVTGYNPDAYQTFTGPKSTFVIRRSELPAWEAYQRQEISAQEANDQMKEAGTFWPVAPSEQPPLSSALTKAVLAASFSWAGGAALGPMLGSILGTSTALSASMATTIGTALGTMGGNAAITAMMNQGEVNPIAVALSGLGQVVGGLGTDILQRAGVSGEMLNLVASSTDTAAGAADALTNSFIRSITVAAIDTALHPSRGDTAAAEWQSLGYPNQTAYELAEIPAGGGGVTPTYAGMGPQQSGTPSGPSTNIAQPINIGGTPGSAGANNPLNPPGGEDSATIRQAMQTAGWAQDAIDSILSPGSGMRVDREGVVHDLATDRVITPQEWVGNVSPSPNSLNQPDTPVNPDATNTQGGGDTQTPPNEWWQALGFPGITEAQAAGFSWDTASGRAVYNGMPLEPGTGNTTFPEGNTGGQPGGNAGTDGTNTGNNASGSGGRPWWAIAGFASLGAALTAGAIFLPSAGTVTMPDGTTLDPGTDPNWDPNNPEGNDGTNNEEDGGWTAFLDKWGPLLSTGVNLIGGLINSWANSNATDAITDQQRQILDETKRQFDEISADLEPWVTTGRNALDRLNTRMDDLTAPIPGEYTYDPFSFEAEPGYQFRLGQGNLAIERAAAATGFRNSGPVMKELTRYGQDFASGEYNNSWNRWLGETKFNYGTWADNWNREAANRDREFNVLNNLSTGGANAAARVGQFGQQALNTRVNAMNNIGNAEASNDLSQGGGWINALNGASRDLLYDYYRRRGL